RIDDPRLAVNYDPSNAVVAGEDPIALLDAVLPRVHSMHASDRYLKPGVSWDDLRERRLGYASGLVHGVIGEGINDYDAILSRLAGAGFDGWISLEDGMNGLPDMKKSVDFLREKIARHFG
ncbi:MAG TPA: sugar phosphate isomerase/epimerase, partial [Limnochordia bacterium]|nr:sugar phosphate isomerase/epimerase [Limnochordia bacterium]